MDIITKSKFFCIINRTIQGKIDNKTYTNHIGKKIKKAKTTLIIFAFFKYLKKGLLILNQLLHTIEIEAKRES